MKEHDKNKFVEMRQNAMAFLFQTCKSTIDMDRNFSNEDVVHLHAQPTNRINMHFSQLHESIRTYLGFEKGADLVKPYIKA